MDGDRQRAPRSHVDRASSRGNRTVLCATLIAAAALVMSCDDDELPTNEGVWWTCSSPVFLPGVVGCSPDEDGVCDEIELPDQVVKFHTSELCANPTCGAPGTCDQNAYFLRVLSACQGQCEDQEHEHGLYASCCPPSVSFTQNMSCPAPDVSASDRTCGQQAQMSGGGGPAMYLTAVDPDQSTAVVSVTDVGSGTATVSGVARFSIGKMCEPDCPLAIAELRLTAPPFGLGGETVSDLFVLNHDVVETVLAPNGTFVVPPGALRMSADFAFAGRRGGVTAVNEAPLHGTFDRSTRRLTLEGSVVAQGAALSFAIQGNATTFPPDAVPQVPAQVECNLRNAARVPMNGTASTSDVPIVRAMWASPPNRFHGTGLIVEGVLPLGDNFVELMVVDANGAADAEIRSVRVVDTTPPSIQGPPNVTARLCQPSGVVQIGQPTATDICKATTTVNGSVISRNGVALAPPIPVVGGQATLGVGTYQVRWTASDGVNQSQRIQTVTVGGKIQTSQSFLLEDRASVRIADNTGAAVLNAGSGQTRIGNDALSGAILSVGPVSVLDRARTGAITSSGTVTISSTAVVGSPILQGTPVILPAPPTLPAFPAPTQPGFTLNAGQTRTLTPGSYGGVTLNSQSTLILGTGDYFFTSFVMINSQVTMRATPTTRVFVKDTIAFRSPFTNSSGQIQTVTLGFAGTSALLEARFNGTLIAPNASVTFGAGSGLTFTGSFFGKTFQVRPDNRLVCQ